MNKTDDKTSSSNIELLTCEEVAQILHYKTSTIYSWISNKQIDKDLYYKIGNRRILFDKNKLFLWIQNGAELKKRGDI